jgi:hypothetical protein
MLLLVLIVVLMEEFEDLLVLKAKECINVVLVEEPLLQDLHALG